MSGRPLTQLRVQLPRMVVFAAVAREKSFAAAASALGVSRSVVSEALSELEEELGCRLVHRSTRGLRLTEEGERFASGCQALTEQASETWASLSEHSGQVQGVLRVTCPSLFAGRLVVPTLAELSTRHGVRAELRVDDRRLDLIGEGLDVSLRVGIPRDSSLALRRLAKMPEVLCAAPALARKLSSLEALTRQHWVIHAELPRRFTFTHASGRRQSLTIDPALTTNSAEALVELLASGAGVGVVPLLLVERDLEQGRLARVLPEFQLPAVDLFALYPSRQHVPLRTRLFIDALMQRLA